MLSIPYTQKPWNTEAKIWLAVEEENEHMGFLLEKKTTDCD